MNACLQCLAAIEDLRDYYLDRKFKQFHDTKTVSHSNSYSRMMSEFYDEIFQYDQKMSKTLSLKTIKDCVRKKFTPTMQHDSHEFLMHLLSQLQDEETPVNNKKFNGDVATYKTHKSLDDIFKEYFELNPGIVDKLFTGIDRSVVKCASPGCQYESITYKPFSVRSLSYESKLDKALTKSFETS